MRRIDNPFKPFLDHQGYVLLDGGLGTALQSAGCDLGDSLWSARVLLDNRDALRSVHTAFLEAGADVLASCTYQASVAGFATAGRGQEDARALIRGAVSLAVEARDSFHHGRERLRPLVAASVGPYGAILADGSEYTGDYGLSSQELYTFHRDRWWILAEAGADLMACETIPSILELDALLRLLGETESIWAWISFSCRDSTHLADGTSLEKACAMASGYSRVAAVGLNCVSPELVPSAIQVVRCATELPVIVYPNSGEGYDPQSKAWHNHGSVMDLAEAAPEWVAAGAAIVGGCCRTDPELIQRIRAALSKR